MVIKKIKRDNIFSLSLGFQLKFDGITQKLDLITIKL